MDTILFTTVQAARYLRVTQANILQRIKLKTLKAQRIKQGLRFVWRIRKADLDRAVVHRTAELPLNPDGSIQQINATGLCMCGCGESAPTAPKTSKQRGLIKGQYCRFIKGHNGRALSKVQYVIDSAGCWLWQRHIRKDGYGYMGRGLAHKVFYERARGPVPKGKELDHKCRVKRCVNPDHLEPVPHPINVRRGASPQKLNEAKVAEIRARYAIGNISQQALADEFQVSQPLIGLVVRYKAWPN